MIIQIMPARDGEKAVFAGDEVGGLNLVQLSGWALVQDCGEDVCAECDGGSRIVGFVKDSIVEEFRDFIGYLRPDENINPEWEEHAKGVRKLYDEHKALEKAKNKIIDEVSKPKDQE